MKQIIKYITILFAILIHLGINAQSIDDDCCCEDKQKGVQEGCHNNEINPDTVFCQILPDGAIELIFYDNNPPYALSTTSGYTETDSTGYFNLPPLPEGEEITVVNELGCLFIKIIEAPPILGCCWICIGNAPLLIDGVTLGACIAEGPGYEWHPGPCLHPLEYQYETSGCIDPAACNYNPEANEDNGSCNYGEVSCPVPCNAMIGCTDETACNFDANANCNDGSCEYGTCGGCTDLSACNYNPAATIDDGSCIAPNNACPSPCNVVLGCTNPEASNYDAAANCDDGSCILNQGCTNPNACNYIPSATLEDGTCEFGDTDCPDPCNPILGCTDFNASNYNPTANCEDGSCVYPEGCTNPAACNYDFLAVVDDGSCDLGNLNCPDPCNAILGCTDATACNYNPSVNCDDGSCDYSSCTNASIGDYVWNDINGDGIQDPSEPGIEGVLITLTFPSGTTTTQTTDQSGFYDFTNLAVGDYVVTVGDGPPGTQLTTIGSYTVNLTEGQDYNDADFGFAAENIPGCTATTACNYNPNATEDDGSCDFGNTNCPDACSAVLGCTDPDACNYDATANCDNGSCDYGNQNCPDNPCDPECDSDPCQVTVDFTKSDCGECNGVLSIDVEGYLVDNINQWFIELWLGQNSSGQLLNQNATNSPPVVYDQLCEGDYFIRITGIAGVVEDCINEFYLDLSGDCDYGCTDPIACNYNPESAIDDGSCDYGDANCPESPCDCDCETPELFNQYSFLNNLIDPCNCNNQVVTEYDLGPYAFISITTNGKLKLYFEDGTPYCNNSASYDCISAYGLGDNITDVWECPNMETPVCNPYNDYAWLAEVLPLNSCYENTEINVYDLGNYSFVEIVEGNTGTTYFEDGTYYCSTSNGFNCRDLYNLTPECLVCNFKCEAERPEDELFNDYDWLNGLVDKDNCTNEMIYEYQIGSYAYVLVVKDNIGKLYLNDGTFYCEDVGAFSCTNAYDLQTPDRTWACQASSNDESISERFGAEDNNVLKFNIFPNPNNGQFELLLPHLGENGGLVNIYNTTGQLIKSFDSTNQGTMKVDLIDVTSGIYFIEVTDGYKSAVKRMVIQK